MYLLFKNVTGEMLLICFGLTISLNRVEDKVFFYQVTVF